MPREYDIAVLGATAAGYVAAIQLARARRHVVLIDSPGVRAESPLADWIPADLPASCPPLRSIRLAATDGAFRAVQFHSAELDRQAVFRSRSTAGFVLRAKPFLKALAAVARAAGVRRIETAEPVRPELREDQVALPSKPVTTARLLLVAHQGPAEAMAELSLPDRSPPPAGPVVCGMNVPLTAARAEKLDKDLHVVAMAEPERLGVFFAARGLLHVRIIFGGPQPPPPEAGAAELARLVADLQRSGLVGRRVNLARATAAAWRPPCAAALELETHLAKRSLLIGTAGGFAAALSGQTIDPGVRSATIAARVARRALASGRLQERLGEFEKAWRDELADRIRPLSTSLKMLLPMVFTNKAMTTRFARAFLYGENF